MFATPKHSLAASKPTFKHATKHASKNASEQTPKHVPNSRFGVLALEPRLLFDGAGALATAELIAAGELAQNHDPIAAADCRVLQIDEAIVNGAAITGNAWGDYADTDPDGDVLQADGSYTYTPDSNLSLAPGASLTEVFTYSLCDNQGGAARTTLTLTLVGAPAEHTPGGNTSVNHAPIGEIDYRALEIGQTAIGQAVLGSQLGDNADSDPDGDSVTVVGVVSGRFENTSQGNVGQMIDGAYGQLRIEADGSYRYQPFANLIIASGQSVQDAFTYTISDGHGGEDSTWLKFNVSAAPKPIEDVPIDLSLRDDKPNVTATSSDPGRQISSVLELSPLRQFNPDSALAGTDIGTGPGTGTDTRTGTNNATLSQYIAPLAQTILVPLSETRPATLEVTRVELPRDAFAPFSPERILGVIQGYTEPLKAAAGNSSPIEKAATDTAAANEDCVTVNKPAADRNQVQTIKPKAVRPSVFAKDDPGVGRNFSEQVNQVKRGFKAPAKVRTATPIKDC